jgi:hypothetical protein
MINIVLPSSSKQLLAFTQKTQFIQMSVLPSTPTKPLNHHRLWTTFWHSHKRLKLFKWLSYQVFPPCLRIIIGSEQLLAFAQKAQFTQKTQVIQMINIVLPSSSEQLLAFTQKTQVIQMINMILPSTPTRPPNHHRLWTTFGIRTKDSWSCQPLCRPPCSVFPFCREYLKLKKSVLIKIIKFNCERVSVKVH